MDFDFTKEPGQKLLDRNLNTAGEPLVSIITPFFNPGKFFEQTFNYVMNQTFPWFEWIIVDDGSTDEASLALLERLSRLDQRVTVIHQDNGGQSAARNTGIQNSRTQIIVPLDADDLITPPFLEELFFSLEKNPDAAWAYSDSVGFGEQEYLWKQAFSVSRMKIENLLVCTAAIRKEWLKRVGGYEVTDYRYDEDWHLWLRLLAQGAWPVHISGYHFWYRRSASGARQTVQQDRELKSLSKEKIRAAARLIETDTAAIEYPRNVPAGGYHAPKASSWKRKVFSTHDKLHVLMLLPWMEMGGADLFNLDVCARLDKSRFEVGIITTQPGENTWQQRFADHVTDIFNLPEFLDIENWPEFISYYIKSREVDVLFLSNSYYGYYLVPWLRKEFPDLVIIDYVHMEEWYWRNGGYARTSGVMGEIVEKTYVCNERTRQVLIKDFGRTPESVETLYIGVDHEKYDASKVEAGQAKKQLKIEENCPVILFPCRLHPQKRPFLMLEIAKELREKMPGTAFAVVGDGPQLEELKIAVRQAGLKDTVYFAGRQSDMLPWYRDAALTLICSLKEGLALTAYESLSMGVPVITSDVGGQRELIDERVGRILPLMQDEESDLDSRDFCQKEVDQYVDAILSLLDNKAEYEGMRAACRKRIVDGFSSEIMIRKLEAILTTLVSDPERKKDRQGKAQELARYSQMVGQLPALMGEIEAYEGMYKNIYSSDTKNELMRLASSRWGSRAIKLAFKLKLNRLFR